MIRGLNESGVQLGPMTPFGRGVMPADGFVATCPKGHRTYVGLVLRDVGISNSLGNIEVECLRCHAYFDTAPGDDVVVDTVGGRLRVREVVRAVRDLRDTMREASLDDVRAARDTITAVRQGAPADLTNSDSPALRQWAQDNQVLASAIVTVLGSVILALLNFMLAQQAASPAPAPERPEVVVINQEPDDEQLGRLVEDYLRDAEKSEQP